MIESLSLLSTFIDQLRREWDYWITRTIIYLSFQLLYISIFLVTLLYLGIYSIASFKNLLIQETKHLLLARGSLVTFDLTQRLRL